MDPVSALKPRVQRCMVWAGVVLLAVYSVGMIPLTGFLPAPSPHDSSEEIAQMYQDDQTRIRLGCVIMAIAGALYVPWAAVIVMWIRRMETGYPSLTYACTACIAFMVMIWEAFPMVWGIAAYRPGDVDPDITRTLNDTGWFLFLVTWPPFALFSVLTAVAILNDHNVPAIYPRWVAYLNLWLGLILFPGVLIMFCKDGPVAQDGVLSLYLPLVVYFGYIVAMTVMTLRAITAEEQRLRAATPDDVLTGAGPA